MLDVEAIKESNSPVYIAQKYVLNAWMARLSHDYEKYLPSSPSFFFSPPFLFKIFNIFVGLISIKTKQSAY